MRKTLTLILIGAFMLTMLLTGVSCKEEAAPVEEAAEEVEEAVEGAAEEVEEAVEGAAEEEVPIEPKGTLVYGLQEPPTTGEWDPQFLFGLQDLIISSLVFDPLWGYDENMEIVPKLATSWDQLNPTTLRVNLREGVKFHNGTPFTASDVKATLERVSNPEGGIPHGLWWAQVEVQIIDDYTIDIIADPPFYPLENVLAVTAILSAKDIEEPEILKERPNGTGYYKFVEYDEVSGKVFLTANIDYWGDPPKIKETILQYLSDPDTLVAALLSGEIQITDRNTGPVRGLSIEASPDTDVLVVDAPDTMIFVFNCEKPYFQDKKVRQAFAYAIDREALVTILGGSMAASVADNAIAPTLDGYQPQKAYEYNPEKARELLEEAGYPNGFEINLPSSSLWAFQKDVTLSIAQNLEDIGIKVNVVQLESGTYGSKYTTYDVALCSWGAMTNDADMALSIFLPPLGPAIFHWEDPEFERLFNNQRTAVNEEERLEAINEVAEYLREELPGLPLYNPKWVFGYSKNLKNYAHNNTFGELLHDVELEE